MSNRSLCLYQKQTQKKTALSTKKKKRKKEGLEGDKAKKMQKINTQTGISNMLVKIRRGQKYRHVFGIYLTLPVKTCEGT